MRGSEGTRGWSRRGRLLLSIVGAAMLLAAPAGKVSGQGDPPASLCAAAATAYVNPSLLNVGDAVYVSTKLSFDCPERRHQYHLVVVVDRSAVGRDAAAPWVAGELQRLVEQMSLASNPDVRLAVVAYDDRATVLCHLTDDQEQLAACLDDLQPRHTGEAEAPNLAAGIAEGEKTLILGRATPGGEHYGPRREGLLVLARAEAVGNAREAEQAAWAAGYQGISVSVACLGGACNESVLPRLATGGRYYDSSEWSQASRAQVVEAWATLLRVRAASFHEFLDPGFEPLMDRADPPDALYDPHRHLILWPLVFNNHNRILVSYMATAREPGTRPVRSLGYVAFQDTQGLSGSLLLPLRKVSVAERGIQRVFLPELFRRDTQGIKTVLFGR